MKLKKWQLWKVYESGLSFDESELESKLRKENMAEFFAKYLLDEEISMLRKAFKKYPRKLKCYLHSEFKALVTNLGLKAEASGTEGGATRLGAPPLPEGKWLPHRGSSVDKNDNIVGYELTQ
ncbi:MAG: hypothetical protein NTX79_00395 [Candidatus Micrarchaeota archaeon]|nr:hypothetical protein [Candidatus Micrarchaeota archaeon]